jgi:hypothetical protein
MLPVLPCAEFRLHFHVEGPPRLPIYAGSAWRGAFGHALKRTICVVRGTPCAACMLYRNCAYPYLFETPPAPDSAKLSRYTAAPHPYVLVIDPDQRGSDYSLGLILIGKGRSYLPYLIHAFGQAGAEGVGAGRQPFHLTCVRQNPMRSEGEEWPIVHAPDQPLAPLEISMPAMPPIPRRLRIELDTPLRLRHKEHNVTPQGFRFNDLFGSLLRRISLLSYFHTDTPLETDFAGLTQRARTVELLDAKLEWWDWTRYSSRQDQEIAMGGLLGHFSLDGGHLEEFWPYLWLGQWTHAGKAATMGLGRYRIEPDDWSCAKSSLQEEHP